MIVSFFATLRQITGGKTVEFDLPEETTARQLVAAAIDQFPPLRRELLNEVGDLWPHVHVFINGRDVHFLNGLDTVIKADDKVTIFPAVAGG